MSACREADLDALLAGELAPEDAARVDAHVDTCPACRHAMTWLRLERGWMAQRARRMPPRPALDFAALEARLSRPAIPTWVPLRGAWSNWGRMLMAATAAVAFVGLSLTQGGATSLGDEPFGRDTRPSMLGEACEDPSREAVAALEASVGACLVASPFISSR
ncbi:zf-HC2 domain-containing protein [Pyxidicoccus parkwayensis]|jgi:anti-sigma factor RsiW|uniref:Zf-HC2 domain-containing protein n=1 Tax=Pyxidicoccus parkwayensis TaxID=2813578 RepID=A0ABX7NS06_9BACT|nr:zf-HC2 domain-containing protein [Pyxidicoccus parkwaysis]QSQ21671.1 zf-HC2 domain-containing protein [Pyxidicoccus parkwaysis]